MKIEKQLDTEQEEPTKEIIKYALTYLLSNLDDDVVEDMSDFVGTDDADEIESILQKAIDDY